MFKSKSALSFNEFMNKLNELRNFGNNYGQFVVIDNNEKTVHFVPLVAMEQKTTKLPPIIEETVEEFPIIEEIVEEVPLNIEEESKEKELEEELEELEDFGVVILKDPSSWSLFMNIEIDLEQKTAYKRKRSISSQDLIMAEEEEEEEEAEEEDKTKKKVVKRIKCVEEDNNNNNKYALGLLSILLWSLVIIFA